MFKFVIRGARGTMPACGQDYIKYGGNTTCYSIHNDNKLIIFDAGTGISNIINNISPLSGKNTSTTIFFTHFHMDHIIGLPYFNPLYNKEINISIMADPRRKDNWKNTLQTFMGKPYWPVGIGECDAIMKFEDIPVERDYIEFSGVKISWFRVPHPQQCLAYKVEISKTIIIIATDVEYDENNINPAFINFCHNANHLIFDAQYTPEEYSRYKGWGHSTWKTGTMIAKKANVDQLILTHHAPRRKDHEIDSILETAKSTFLSTVAATENMEITIPDN